MDDGATLLRRLQADPHGARLLRLLTDHAAEHRRTGRRGPRIQGALPDVAVTGDALVDLATGRVPARVDLTSPHPPAELAGELRRRARGEILRDAVQGVIELRSRDEPLHVRVLPPPLASGEPLAERVLTIHAAELRLDGELTDPGGDLAAGAVRLTDSAALRRRPEALLHVARLAVRPGLRLDDATLRAAIAARRAGAPGSAPVAHLGRALRDLLASAEAAEGLAWLRDLAPELPLGDGIVVDEDALRRALARPPADRLDAALRALAPGAPPSRLAAFRAGAHLHDPA